ncbi:MAG: universal stress protein [Methanocellales archaeon]|nr:universal stress protein [Methanocellales archaeon]
MKKPIKKLLVPIDPLNNNDSLTKTVATLAKQLGAKVHILVVVFMRDAKKVIRLKTTEEHAKLFREQGIETTCELIRLGDGQNRLAAKIVEVAKGYDMIVMGHHKFDRIYRFLHQSIAQDVINTASCPVVVVPG